MATASTPAAAVEVVSRRLASLPDSITPTRLSTPARLPISANGRFVAFSNVAGDVVASPSDGNNSGDIFVRDLQGGSTALVSVNAAGTAAGTPAPTRSHEAVAVSADGRYVLFNSDAVDLVAGDANGFGDVFVRDLQLGTTELVSVNAAGSGAGDNWSFAVAMSPDGRFVLFTSEALDLVAGGTSTRDVFVRDRQTDTTILASLGTSGQHGNGPSLAKAISSDGRYVSFESHASNLVGADSNGVQDVFRRDLLAGTTQLVSANQAGSDTGNGFSTADAMSTDGRFVLFHSFGTNLTSTPDNNAGSDVFVRDLTAGLTSLASVNSAGTATGAAASSAGSISDDGRYVAFWSDANDLVAGDPQNRDVFVRDLQTGATTLVSVDSGGVKGNGPSEGAAVSSDGRYVLFTSSASNLAAGDANGASDAFLRDRQLGTTTLVSVATGGQTGNGGSNGGAITPDGRYAVLTSDATDLVAGADLNGQRDVFVRDLQLATTTLASVRGPLPVAATGNNASFASVYARAISADGRHVLFASRASDLVSTEVGAFEQLYVGDLQTGATALASVDAAGTGGANSSSSTGIALTIGGRFALFDSRATNLVAAGIDNNARQDVFVRDLQAGGTQLISLNAAGNASANDNSAAKAITPSGRYVLFNSDASDLVPGDGNGDQDAFVRDRQLGTTELVSVNLAGSASGNDISNAEAISPNGRYVLFSSYASDLVSVTSGNRIQAYVRDRLLGTTELVSINTSGTDGSDTGSWGIAISDDGRYVLFAGSAGDLVPDDANGDQDAFVRDRQTASTALVTRNSGGTGSANGYSYPVALSADGRYVLFASFASDLVPNDLNGKEDVFRRDLQTNSTVLVSVNGAGTGSGNDSSSPSSMSSDGQLVGFYSLATDLVSMDSNGEADSFLRDVGAATTVVLNAYPGGASANGETFHYPLVAANGTRAVFDNDAPDLVANDFNVASDVFAVATGRPLPTLPFADAFELGDLTAWSAYQP